MLISRSTKHEVIRIELAHVDPDQLNRVGCINADQRIAASVVRGAGLQRGKVGKQGVVDFDLVDPPTEVGDHVPAEPGVEYEGVDPAVTGQPVIARAAGECVIAAAAEEQVGTISLSSTTLADKLADSSMTCCPRFAFEAAGTARLSS